MRQALFKELFDQLEQSGQIDNIVEINQKITEIIQQRDTDPNTQTPHAEVDDNESLSMDKLPSELMGEIASFLELDDYEQFEKSNRKIFIQLRSNSTLFEIPTDEIYSLSKTHPDEYLYLIREEEKIDWNKLTNSMISNRFRNAQKISVSSVNDEWIKLIPKFKNVKDIAFDSTLNENIIDLDIFNWDTINRLSFFSHPEIPGSIWSGVDLWFYVSKILQKAENIEYFHIAFDVEYSIQDEDEFIRIVVESNILQNLKAINIDHVQNKQNLNLLLTKNGICHRLKSLSLDFTDEYHTISHKLSEDIKFDQLTELCLCNVASEDIVEIIDKTSLLEKLTLYVLKDWEWIEPILKTETLKSLYININDHNKFFGVMNSIQQSLTNRQSFNFQVYLIANYEDESESFENDMCKQIIELVEELKNHSTHFRFKLEFLSKFDKHLNILKRLSTQYREQYSTKYCMQKTENAQPFSDAFLIISNVSDLCPIIDS